MIRSMVRSKIAAICLIILLTDCQPKTVVNQAVETSIKVDIAAPTRTSHGTVENSLSNCEGNTELIQTLGSVTTIQKKTTLNKIAIGIDGSEYEVLGKLKLQIEIEVENAYQRYYTNAISRLEDVKINANPGYQTNYILEYENLVYRDIVNFSVNNSMHKVSYKYELLSPKIIFQETNNCRVVDTPTMEASQPTLSPTGKIVTLRIDNFLYFGPNTEYDIVDQKKRLSGEKFNLVAKNPRGDWFLVQATNGDQGWLYFSWVVIDFDPEIIPVTTDFPPLYGKPIATPADPDNKPIPEPKPTIPVSYP